ncbi:unnamed protein product [Ceutorhynchus assimilis]|uniref:Myb-like, SWIRM and MPN domain-containing protein 1 n=1 Tax=Ceutorhynchus assimilis TaxID=467358 RepID=A0A9N9MVH6_9CUCU|nr:unnamed protein product [Ceutorhynchus assimilis]
MDNDEIDVLGEFNMEPSTSDTNLFGDPSSLFENSDLLNCDYTIHPQWLLDKPSANPDNWYEQASASSTIDSADIDAMGVISTENCITDESGWTEKEKNLLQRGLEIFGKSSINLAQFIGTKNDSEVKYYLKNFAENLDHYKHNLLNSDQIPVSFEEEIAGVDTSFPTITDSPANKKQGTKSFGSDTSRNSKKGKNEVIKSKSVAKIKLKTQQHNKTKSQGKGKIHHKIESKKKSEDIILLPAKEICTGTGRSVSICEGEEIVTIKQAEDDDSLDVDVEDLDDCMREHKTLEVNIEKNTTKANQDDSLIVENDTVLNNNLVQKPLDDNVKEEIAKQLETLDVPHSEVILDSNTITDLEKYFHPEYFTGKGVKSPERYLKIRNYIVSAWNASKPEYTAKTKLRAGLKNCGDVHCISRVHYFLEQIGAINFGCAKTKYNRPLSQNLTFYTPRQHKKTDKFVGREPTELGPRQRFKKKFINDGEGGCTIAHGEKGEIIDTTIVNEEPPRPRFYKKPIQLIHCKPFTDNPQQYCLKISMSTLLLMDFHSHSYLNEIMGLIGGYWEQDRQTLKICCYEPCKNVASSSTECEMCPISQAAAADIIHSKNFDVLGWFHSHPNFAPQPSQQDLETQHVLQEWIGSGRPCIGMIMTPFNRDGALISSPFTCWMVEKNSENKLQPYRFTVEVVTNDLNLPNLVNSIKTIICTEDKTSKHKKIIQSQPYFMDTSISHLDKFLSSVKMRLAKTGALPRSECDQIVQSIRKLLQEPSVPF